MSDPNLNQPVFDEPRTEPGFEALRSRIGRQVGSERLGASLWEIPAGQAAQVNAVDYHDGEVAP